MQLTDNRLLLSASDLVAFLECEHLSALDLRVARGIEVIEQTRTDSTDLVARKGDEHEHAFLESLIEQRADVVVVPAVFDGVVSYSEALKRTEAAMRWRRSDLPGRARRRRVARICGLSRARASPLPGL
jgi:hypothetical protein